MTSLLVYKMRRLGCNLLHDSPWSLTLSAPLKNWTKFNKGSWLASFPNPPNIFPSGIFIIHTPLSLGPSFLKREAQSEFFNGGRGGEGTNGWLKGISRLNALILLMPAHQGRYLSVHYQGNWGLSLAPDPGLSQRTSREGLSGYRRNVFLPGCRPMKAQAALAQEGPCLNRKEQTV